MKILGVTGFHDSSAVLLQDGEIKLFYKEERLTRKKRAFSALQSVDKILQSHKDIDYFAACDPYNNEDTFYKTYSRVHKSEMIDYSSSHHLCHASLAFYNSGFENCLVFVIDRNGSVIQDIMRESESVFEASYPCQFKPLHKNYWLNNIGCAHDARIIKEIMKFKSQNNFTFNIDSLMSIVKVYESATTLIGQHPLENGKTMGLASYGKDKKHVNFFVDGRPIDNYFIQDHFISEYLPSVLFKKHLDKITKEITKDNYKFYADYAYQVQKQTQQEVLKFVSEWVYKTGIKNVCLTGGYALNVVCNEYLLRNLRGVNFYFEPLADDTGNSIGAAMLLHRSLTKDKTMKKLRHTFFHGCKTYLQHIGTDCNVNDIVNHLIDQKTVAVFNRQAEAGPRALGNRSILFDARNPNAKQIVNVIKQREWYRPFAGFILEEHFQDYFETHGLEKSEFMTVSFYCKKPEIIPGIVHVDNTCRIQTVNDNIPHIRDLLEKFYIETGCPSLLNTSFNLAGEALIETQQEAIECFYNSNLDVLWFPEIGKCLIK
jgi:carbamoyltransferase